MERTLVFDLDGTILDTLDDLTDAVNFALFSYGLKKRNKEEIRAFIGNGVRKLIERAIGGEEYNKKEEVFQTFKGYYAEHCAVKTKPYAGITEVLQALQKRGIKTAVLSNKSDAEVKKLVNRYFPNLFNEIEGENERAGIPRKPNPKGLWKVMERLNATAESTLYIGDSEVDIQTANNAGVECISVTWGFKEKAFLLGSGAKTTVDTPEEILNLV